MSEYKNNTLLNNFIVSNFELILRTLMEESFCDAKRYIIVILFLMSEKLIKLPGLVVLLQFIYLFCWKALLNSRHSHRRIM